MRINVGNAILIQAPKLKPINSNKVHKIEPSVKVTLSKKSREFLKNTKTAL